MKMTLLKSANGQPVAAGLTGWIDDMFNQTSLGPVFHDDFASGLNGFSSFPLVNIQETSESYEVDLAAPGLDKSDFRINLEGNLLTISSELKLEKKEDKKNLVRREFGFQSFKRTFTVDDKIDASKIVAKYDNGILKVSLPKKDAPVETQKSITVE